MARFLRRSEVLARLSMKREALREAIMNKLFPPGVPIFPGGRAYGWLESEVDQYIEARREQEPQKEKGEFPKRSDGKPYKKRKATKAKR